VVDVEVRLLGGFEIRVDGRPDSGQDLVRRDAARLVKLLALAPGHRLHREQVFDALWPDAPFDRLANRLHKAVHFVRKATGAVGAVVLSGETVALFPDADRLVVDVERFEHQASKALDRDRTGPDRAAALEEAIDAYPGELLPFDIYEEWTAARRHHLQSRFRDVLRAAGRFDRLVALDPTDEQARAAVMRAMLAAGDRAGVLRQFDLLREALDRTVGVEPGPEVCALRSEAERLTVGAPGGAPSAAAGSRGGDGRGARGTPLPVPLTPFVGRVEELGRLLAAMAGQRLVTATGPGGVGKTRLALAAAQRLAADHPDGAVFVDLVAVTEPAQVAAAVADAIGLPEERAGEDRQQILLAALADRDGLLVLDNCEQVLDGVRPLVERILRACPQIRVLATSRIRLMLPFETVLAVPGLSLGEGPDPEGGVARAPEGDACTLFVERMTAAGAGPPSTPEEWAIVQRVCRVLDGVALAIELAAARVPGIGLDGLAGALDAHLPLLEVGHRAEERHRSMRAMIDWSYDLLDDDERQVLRAAAVFAAGFDVGGLASVLGWERAAVLDAVGRLVDWNLVARVPGGVGRYRMLETIRQYGVELVAGTAEEPVLRAGHRAWVAGRVAQLGAGPGVGGDEGGDAAWCAEVDAVLDEGRAALRRVGDEPGEAGPAGRLSGSMAALAFQRGRPGEAQHRYEEAAAWAGTAPERQRNLRLASGAAAARLAGAEAVDLLRAAADATGGTGDEAAEDLAMIVMYLYRCPGIMGRPVTVEEAEGYLARAREASRGGARAQAAVAMAEGWAPDFNARSQAHTERALALSGAAGDPLLHNIVLDQVIAGEMAKGDLQEALSVVRSRVALIEPWVADARTGFEIYDASHMACSLLLGSGELAEARRWADVVAALPFFREQRHVGLARRLEVDAVAGEPEAVVANGELFERDWIRAGRPRASNLSIAAFSVSVAHRMLGDDGEGSRWRGIADLLGASSGQGRRTDVGWLPVLDGLALLHVGRARDAVTRLAVAPDDRVSWSNQYLAMCLPWYAALWAEAAVLAGEPDASERVARAMAVASGNPIAVGILERCRALLAGDGGALTRLAGAFTAAGCPYQERRSRSLG